MILTEEEEKMLSGARGEAVSFAMGVLVRTGALFGAEKLIDIAGAHIDGCCYQTAGDAGLDFAERLAGMRARVVVPTTTNVSGRDIRRWEEFKQPELLAEKCRRMEAAYLSLGAVPTWTCAPYLTDRVPSFGQHVVWAESNAIAYGNSVLGLRTHRYGDFFDACAAITGKAPWFGLHLDENRKADVTVDLEGFGGELAEDTSVYGLLGYHLGKLLGNKVPLLRGVPRNVSSDCLKAFSAAGAASGALALFHVAGVTPEARKPAAHADRGQKEQITVRPSDLEAVQEELCTARDGAVDFIALGCPHFSSSEALRLARAIGGRKKHGNLECFVFTNRTVLGAMEKSGVKRELEDIGVRVSTDTCILHWDLSGWGFSAMATNSAKFAKFAPACLGVKVRYATLEQCADAVASGRIRT